MVISVTPSGRGAARAVQAIGLAVLALACATPISEKDVETKLRIAGQSVSRLGDDFLVVPIYADTKAAAWTLLAEAKSGGGTDLGRALSHDFRREAKRRRGIVVGGPYSDLTRAIVLDAFVYVGSRSLAGLTLVYVGDDVHARELRLAAKAHQVRVYQRDMP